MNTPENKTSFDEQSVVEYLDRLGDQRVLEIVLLMCSGLVFLVSLFCPVAPGVFGSKWILGYQLLLFVGLPAWWANPCLVTAWFCGYHRLYKGLISCSVAATGLASSVFLIREHPPFEAGYYVWLASFVLALAAGLIKPGALVWNRLLEFIARPRLRLRHLFVLIFLASIASAILSVKYHRDLENQRRLERVEAYTSIMRVNIPSHMSYPPPEDVEFSETRLCIAGGSDDDLRHLVHFTALESLELRSPEFTDEGLNVLRQLVRLKRLEISCRLVTLASLTAISGLPHLEELTLGGGDGMDDSALEEIARIKTLRSLNLQNTQITGRGLKNLVTLPLLRTLILSGEKLSDEGVKQIENLRQIGSLSLTGNQLSDNALQPLRNLPELEALFLARYFPPGAPVNNPQVALFTDEGIRLLRDVKKLRTLSLSSLDITDECMADIGRIDMLESLDIFCNGMTGRNLENLCSLPSFQKLTLYSSRLQPEYLRDLRSCRTLQTLRLHAPAALPSSVLCELKQLRVLSIRGKFEDEALAGIAPLTGLRRLELYGAYGDQGIQHLRGLILLEELTLGADYRGQRRLTDACLTHLRPLKNLSSLRFTNTKVTDTGVRELKSLLSPNLSISR